MYSGYALAFYDIVVSSDAALVCTMFDQFPRSYGRKMQPIRFFFCSKNAKKHKKCIFFALFFKKNCVMYSGYALAFYDIVVSSDAALVCTMF